MAANQLLTVAGCRRISDVARMRSLAALSTVGTDPPPCPQMRHRLAVSRCQRVSLVACPGFPVRAQPAWGWWPAMAKS
eukprot:scaffold305908_cov14-Tisochrysis_lutea.AAC.1